MNHTVQKADAQVMTELLLNGNFLLSIHSGAVSMRISLEPHEAAFLFEEPDPIQNRDQSEEA